jgi:hypothetical protein
MTPQRQLNDLLAKYTPEVRAVAKSALARLRGLIPGAVELIYDNYNALAIGFGPNDRASDAIISVALYPRWVNLFFLHGAKLPDPAGILKGSGSRVRHVVLERPDEIDEPEVLALIHAAIEQSAQPFPARRKVIVKSISANQRPRRRET